MSNEIITCKLKILKAVYSNKDYRIFRCSPIDNEDKIIMSDSFTFSIVGELCYLDEGKNYEMRIQLDKANQYGGTYKVIEVLNMSGLDLDNLDYDESFAILSNITTREQVKNILNAYENFIEIALSEGVDGFDLSKIYNVGEKRIRAYVRELNNKYKYYNTISKLNEYQLSITDCKKLYNKLPSEEDIKELLNNRPYEALIDICTRSFHSVDKLLLEIRPEFKEHHHRCEYLILDVLKKNELTGSTRMNGALLYDVINTRYNAKELLDLVLETVQYSERIHYDEDTTDCSCIDTYCNELYIKNFILEKTKYSLKLGWNWEKFKQLDDITLTDTQLDCPRLFCDHMFSLLVGYSGSGKTTSIKALLNMIEEYGMSYVLLAPTGKASRRITEQTNRRAMTIHRRCFSGEIFEDVVIVDESSMIDLQTFVMLLQKIKNPNCRIVLIGDNAQLMPVGVGCVFDDIINSRIVPMTMLTEIFRYSSNGALYVATNTRQGKPFLDNDDDIIKRKGNTTYVGNNYQFIETSDDNIKDIVCNKYFELIKKGVKPRDILCLSPWNIRELGTYAINNMIQSEINAPKARENVLSRQIEETLISFRVGDKAINKKNDYNVPSYDAFIECQNDNLLSEEDFDPLEIVNGQDGYIVNVLDKHLVIQFDEDLVVFDKMKLNNLLLGYAISVHSSQGSEAKYVINVVADAHAKSLNRNLLYVADTRAKEMHFDIGSQHAFNNALKIDGSEQRKTWLREMLEDELVKEVL